MLQLFLSTVKGKDLLWFEIFLIVTSYILFTVSVIGPAEPKLRQMELQLSNTEKTQ